VHCLTSRPVVVSAAAADAVMDAFAELPAHDVYLASGMPAALDSFAARARTERKDLPKEDRTYVSGVLKNLAHFKDYKKSLGRG
jgi:hypothetical protein